MQPKNLPRDYGQVFDAAALLEMTRANPTGRSSLLGLIGNVVERAPTQLRDARQAWIEGRIEESARSLHTMRGTIGTLGAARFAAAALELESAIRAQQVGRVSGLFDAAGRELAETVAAAASLLLKEAGANVERVKGQGSPAVGSARAEPAADQGKSLPPWYDSMQEEIRNILDDVRQMSDDVKDLSREQLFTEAVASLPSCLVVEDDELIAHVLVHLLTREGYRVQRCADGRAAQQVIKLATEPPGLILLDVMLPYVDGYELIRIIREQKLWSDVPIIMLTAKQQENDIVRALDAGATDYVVKPFQPNELMARLRRILRVKG